MSALGSHTSGLFHRLNLVNEINNTVVRIIMNDCSVDLPIVCWLILNLRGIFKYQQNISTSNIKKSLKLGDSSKIQ